MSDVELQEEGQLRDVRTIPDTMVKAIEGQRWLDAPSYRLEHALALVFTTFGARSRAVQDVLHGTPLGHPLHPALTDVPIGAWTTALVLDAVDVLSPRSQGWGQAAQLATGLGVLGGIGAVLTGLTDWQHTHDRARRSGLVHGLLNSAALGLNAWSWRDRSQGRHARARRASALGYGLVLAGSYLGGHLVFRQRVGVDHSEDAPPTRGFLAVLAEADLSQDTPHQVHYEGAEVVLVRRQGRITAVSGLCSHLAAPMSQGWLYRGQLVCPWHGSRFDLQTGCPVTGPATAPLTRYQTRVAGGQIEIRPADPVLAVNRSGASAGVSS